MHSITIRTNKSSFVGMIVFASSFLSISDAADFSVIISGEGTTMSIAGQITPDTSIVTRNHG